MRGLVATLVFVVACDASEGPPSDVQPRSAPAGVPVSAPNADAPTPEPALRPLEPEDRVRLATLTQAFERGRCDSDARRELRALREQHGEPAALSEALLHAAKACDDPASAAELLARALPDDATDGQRLELGAAWIRATRYEDAAEVLVPLANAMGTSSKAAWLAGFALFHAGRSEDALPLLEAARGTAPTDRPDAWLLIGLCKLHTGDTQGAIAELEAGTTAAAGAPSLWSALARAYAAAGRSLDAERARARARSSHKVRARREATQLRLSAQATALRDAVRRTDVGEVETLVEQMWGAATPDIRRQLLLARAKVYAASGNADAAATDRAQAEALGNPSGETP